eukprot:jgi/Chrpa1/19908/Chrysochromulina_OHIO_Genome00026715-RA
MAEAQTVKAEASGSHGGVVVSAGGLGASVSGAAEADRAGGTGSGATSAMPPPLPPVQPIALLPPQVPPPLRVSPQRLGEDKERAAAAEAERVAAAAAQLEALRVEHEASAFAASAIFQARGTAMIAAIAIELTAVEGALHAALLEVGRVSPGTGNPVQHEAGQRLGGAQAHAEAECKRLCCEKDALAAELRVLELRQVELLAQGAAQLEAATTRVRALEGADAELRAGLGEADARGRVLEAAHQVALGKLEEQLRASRDELERVLRAQHRAPRGEAAQVVQSAVEVGEAAAHKEDAGSSSTRRRGPSHEIESGLEEMPSSKRQRGGDTGSDTIAELRQQLTAATETIAELRRQLAAATEAQESALREVALARELEEAQAATRIINVTVRLPSGDTLEVRNFRNDTSTKVLHEIIATCSRAKPDAINVVHAGLLLSNGDQEIRETSLNRVTQDRQGVHVVAFKKPGAVAAPTPVPGASKKYVTRLEIRVQTLGCDDRNVGDIGLDHTTGQFYGRVADVTGIPLDELRVTHAGVQLPNAQPKNRFSCDISHTNPPWQVNLTNCTKPWESWVQCVLHL